MEADSRGDMRKAGAAEGGGIREQEWRACLPIHANKHIPDPNTCTASLAPRDHLTHNCPLPHLVWCARHKPQAQPAVGIFAREQCGGHAGYGQPRGGSGGQAGRWAGRWAGRHVGGQAGGQADGLAGRRMDWRVDWRMD